MCGACVCDVPFFFVFGCCYHLITPTFLYSYVLEFLLLSLSFNRNFHTSLSILLYIQMNMESLLEALEENRTDALYLFITDVLRDATAFRRFFANLVSVLPQNYSVHRIEAGHEFLKQIVDREDDQRSLFRTITELESLRTLIVSDGYVQRKDCGAVITHVLLQELPRATSLVSLDIHRMELKTQEEVELLSLACESMAESLEELRLTGLFLSGSSTANSFKNGGKNHRGGALDPVLEVLFQFQHLRSLTLGLDPNNLESIMNDNANTTTTTTNCINTIRVVSPHLWSNLINDLSTLQDLTLRYMQLDDEACHAMAKVLQREDSSFLSSLDLRKNTPGITTIGYNSIASALELNFSSWCAVTVDDPRQQSIFHILIELNQHNRGEVVRNFHIVNLVKFLEHVGDNPTAIWHFLRIHDNIRNPLTSYLNFQIKTNMLIQQTKQQQKEQEDESQQQPPQEQQPRKRKAEHEVPYYPSG